MGKTVQQRAMEELGIERMKDPKWNRVYSKIYSKIMAGDYGAWLDAICQQFMPLSIFDAIGFAEVYTPIDTGQIIHYELPVDGAPTSNADVDGNNKYLPNGEQWWQWVKPGEECKIGGVFESVFHGEPYGADGHISFKGKLPFFKGYRGTETVFLSVGEFPLEVGYCTASQTWLRLAESRSLARWPYGSEVIYLFKVVDDRLWCRSWDFDLQEETPDDADNQMRQLKLF